MYESKWLPFENGAHKDRVLFIILSKFYSIEKSSSYSEFWQNDNSSIFIHPKKEKNFVFYSIHEEMEKATISYAIMFFFISFNVF